MSHNSSAEVIYLDLPLDRPASASVCEEAERLGFFFSGVSPQAPNSGDWLRLQFPKCAIDFSLLQIESEFAREMLSYIEGERRRVKS
jgi:hypothetical protein